MNGNKSMTINKMVRKIGSLLELYSLRSYHEEEKYYLNQKIEYLTRKMDEINYLLEAKDKKLQSSFEIIHQKDKMIEYYVKEQEKYKKEAETYKKNREDLINKNKNLLEELEKIKKTSSFLGNFSNQIHFLENEQIQSPKKRKDMEEVFINETKKRKM